MNHEFTLWDKSMGDPVSDNPGPDSNGIQKKRNDGRLPPGLYAFPFSFPFPTLSKSEVLNSSLVSPISPHTADTTLRSTHSPPYDNGPGPQNPQNPQKAQGTWIRRFASSVVSPSSSRQVQQTSVDHSDTSEPPQSLASQMPQTFMEKDISPNVTYDISVRIIHGRFKASNK
jgi:hypothetical protein